MKTNYRVSIAFASYGDAELIAFTPVPIVCLTNNAAFPNLPVTVVQLSALLEAFQDAMNASATGGPEETALKNEARIPLVDALRSVAAHVQSVAGKSLSTLLSSGFDVVDANHASSPLAQPVIMKLDNLVTTQLLLRVMPVDNAKAYHVQISANGGAQWQDGQYSTQSRRIVIPGLTPGTVYSVRVRGLGGSTGSSPWSAPVSLMAT